MNQASVPARVIAQPQHDRPFHRAAIGGSRRDREVGASQPFVKPPTERRPLREQSAAKREWHRGLIGPGPARRGGDEQHELCRRVVNDLNGDVVGIVECLEHVLREGGDRVDWAFDRVEARRNLVERPEPALGRLRRVPPAAPSPLRSRPSRARRIAASARRPIQNPPPSSPSRKPCPPTIRASPAWGSARHATPVPATTLTPQPSDSAPACDVTASSASHTSDAPVAPEIEGAQAVGGDGIGRRGRESEHGPIDPIESAEPPCCGHGVRQRPDGVALEPAHALRGGLAAVGVAQTGARLAAVDAEDADHPARLA